MFFTWDSLVLLIKQRTFNVEEMKIHTFKLILAFAELIEQEKKTCFVFYMVITNMLPLARYIYIYIYIYIYLLGHTM